MEKPERRRAKKGKELGRRGKKPFEIELSRGRTPIGLARQLATELKVPRRTRIRDPNHSLHSRMRKAADRLGLLEEIERRGQYRRAKEEGDHEGAALALSDLIQKLGRKKELLKINWRNP